MKKFILLLVLSFPFFIFSHENVVNFDDNSLIYTPTPTVTPIYKIPDVEVKAWDLLKDTKHLIQRCKQGLNDYPKLFREQMDEGLLKMQKVISTINTAAVLHKRDNIEYAWEEAIADPIHTLELGQGFIDEFDTDIKTMEKNQKKVKEMMKKDAKKFQVIQEVKLKYDMNEKEIFFIKKEIEKFKQQYKSYEARYKMIVKNKEDKINQLIAEHRELHKP